MSRKHEVERKFLVHAGRLPPLQGGTRMVQGYLATSPTVRVRVGEGPEGRGAWLTIKGRGLVGRDEFEYEIPYEEGEALLGLARHSVEKTRYVLPAGEGLVWEIDVFAGANEGLITAELEVDDEDRPFDRPPWLGAEVTRDPAYKNAALARKPFREW